MAVSNLLASNAAWASSFTAAQHSFFTESAKGQSPPVLWIGCADSRVPESVITNQVPGQIFTHRNIANQFHLKDDNINAVLEYGVLHLNISNVVIVGHTDCGGCKAAHQAALDAKHKRSEAPSVGPLDHFLQPLINLHHEIGTDKSVLDLVLANVNRSVHNVAESEVFQKAWEGGWNVSVHGLLYNVSSGFLTDLALSQYNTC